MSDEIGCTRICRDGMGSPAMEREDGHRLRTVLDNILAGVLVIEGDTRRIVDVNAHAAASIGLPREEIVGRICHQFVCPAQKGQCPIADLGQTVDHSERILMRSDGVHIPILKSVVQATWQGREFLIESFVDITEKHAAEQKQAALLRQVAEINEELTHFAYVVSHDLKAPLRGIKLITEWLCEDYGDKLGDDAKEQLDLLQSRVARMHNLIDGVLQYSRVGRIKEEREKMDLNLLIPSIIDGIAPPEHIHITVEPGLPAIECEKTRITQVFQNLLSNAVKFMDKPVGEVHVGCIEEGEFWRFRVADNGPGIEEKYFDRVFKLFQTLAPRDEFESTGVGLALVKKIVEMYGGRIWVGSEYGKGSTFFFTLPMQRMEVNDVKVEAHAVC